MIFNAMNNIYLAVLENNSEYVFFKVLFLKKIENLKPRKLEMNEQFLQLTRGAYLNGGLFELTSTIKFRI